MKWGPPLNLIASLMLGGLFCPPATAQQASPKPATSTQPTTQSEGSLTQEIARAVEMAQQAIRKARPATSPAPRNTLEAEERSSKQPADPNPLPPIAAELVGKRGLIAFRVVEVIPNDPRKHISPSVPDAVFRQSPELPYVVIAECDNPTPTYLSPALQETIARYRAQKVESGIQSTREYAERSKPVHELWIATDDPQVRRWTRGDRRVIRGAVTWSAFEHVQNDYVRARLVLRSPVEPNIPVRDNTEK